VVTVDIIRDGVGNTKSACCVKCFLIENITHTCYTHIILFLRIPPGYSNLFLTIQNGKTWYLNLRTKWVLHAMLSNIYDVPYLVRRPHMLSKTPTNVHYGSACSNMMMYWPTVDTLVYSRSTLLDCDVRVYFIIRWDPSAFINKNN